MYVDRAMSGGAHFIKLDLSDYQHLEFGELSQELLKINTSKGLYHYTHLPYGGSCSVFYLPVYDV